MVTAEPGVWRVEVGLALQRPPRHDATVYITLQADDWMDAELTAIEIACATRKCVMPISTLITDWPEETP